MKLIVEDTRDSLSRASILDKSTTRDDGFKPYLLKGVFAVSEQLNRNHRKYHYDALKREMDRFISEDVNNCRAWGDFEHPTDATVDRKRAAVRILELSENPDKTWSGVATIMYSDPSHNISGSPSGDLLKCFLDYGSPCGFSTRGVGEIVGDYVESYRLSTIDAVMDPSTGVFCEGVLESKEFMVDMHGQIVECTLEEYERSINASTKTFDTAKKREIITNAWDTLLKKI